MNRTIIKICVSACLSVCLLLGLGFGESAEASAYTAKVYADSLNVRSEPAKSAPVTGSLKAGTLVAVSDEQHGWAKVTQGRVTGWVAGYYLKRTSASAGERAAVRTSSASTSKASARSAAATVTADSLRLRSGPGTGYEVTGSLRAKDAVTVLDRENGWLRVSSGGQTGWVSAKYVSSGGTSTAAGTGSAAVSRTPSKAESAPRGGLKGKLIVLDPGHGGSDPGMLGTTYGTLEKTLNLQTALYVRDYLRDAGARVEMTRTRDAKPSLPQRAQLAGKLGADAFVSIHYNSSPKNVSGTLIFFHSESNDMPLARSIEVYLNGGTGLRYNGISFGDYHILRGNPVPSVLLELGFLSDPGDEAVVRTASYQRKAARAIANGLAHYFSK